MVARMSPTRLRRLLYVCFMISGVTGLVFEVVWGRYLSTYIGGSTVAHTIVLGTFMAGLAIGNAWFGRVVDRTPNRLRLYAWLELGIGAACMLFPEYFELLGGLYMRLGVTPHTPGLVALKAALAALALLPACVLIGGTLPALVKAVVGQLQEVGARVGQMYFINTLGALVGVWLGGFVLIEALGVEMSIRLTSLVNVAIGLVFLALSRGRQDALEAGAPASEAHTYSEREITVVLGITALGGFLSMTLEVVWIRLLAVVMGSSTYSFSTMLLGFIGGICLGGLIVAWLMRSDRDALPLLVMTQAGIALSLVALIPFYEQLPYYFNVISSWVPADEGGFSTFMFGKVALCLALMLIPCTLIGMTLPLASRVATRRVGVLGKSVGSVFSINTAGTLVGATVGGLALLPAVGLEATFRLVIGGYVALALLVWGGVGRPRTGRAWASAALAALVVGGIAAGAPGWDRRVLTSGVFRYGTTRIASSYEEFQAIFARREILYYQDGRDATVAVVRMSNGDRAMLINGKADASARQDLMTQRLLGHIGMLLHPEAKETLIIGLGSGATASSVRRHPGAHVDVVEISEGVAEAARLHFADVNDHVLDAPNVELFLGDAKDFLKLQPDRTWDLIVSEPSNPWIAGIGGLFTADYWREVKAHLAPGGLFVQWVQVYEMDDALLEVLLQTFGSVFAHATLWEIDDFDMVIVVSDQALEPDFDAIAARLEHPPVQAELGSPTGEFQVSSVLDVLAMQLVGPALFAERFPGEGPLNTDDHPRIEFMAPRSLFRRDVAQLPGALDERRRCGGSGLLLARYLAEHTPGPRELLGAVRLLGGRGSVFDLPSLKSLIYDIAARRPDDPARVLFGRMGIGVPPEAVRLLQLTSAEPTAASCTQHLTEVATHLIALSTAFHDPAGSPAARWTARCLELAPAALPPSLHHPVSQRLAGCR